MAKENIAIFARLDCPTKAERTISLSLKGYISLSEWLDEWCNQQTGTLLGLGLEEKRF